MSRPFKFKQFTIQQAVNPQKVGADAMLLGAVTKGSYKRILDIGTGTGILALMLAQKNPEAQVTAIEPDLPSVNEARENFQNAPFDHRIMAIHTPLQHFGAMEKFDLIISNPPYFENAFLSENPDRNRARHTNELPVNELYECSSNLLSETGKMAVIIPFDEELRHLEIAAREKLFPHEIIRTVKPDGTFKRSVIHYGFDRINPKISSLVVKNDQNRYSPEYIQLTKDFYLKDLSASRSD